MELAAEARFCVHCRHFVKQHRDAKPTCLMPQFSALDLVLGRRVGTDPYTERQPGGRCGPEGVAFSELSPGPFFE